MYGLKIIGKIILALLLALSFLLMLIQNDPWLLSSVEAKVIELFNTSFQCTMQCKVKSISLLMPSIELENITVEPADSKLWRWTCKNYKLQTSWFSLFFRKIFDAHSILDGLTVYSTVVNNELAIMPHARALLFEPSSLPLKITRATLSRSSLEFVDTARQLTLTAELNADCVLKKQSTKIACVVRTASCKDHEKYIITTVQGTSTITINQATNKPTISATVQMRGKLPWLPEYPDCVFSGYWKDAQGYLDIHNHEHTVALTVQSVRDSLLATLKAALPLSYAKAYLPQEFAESNGLAQIAATADLYDIDNSLKGSVTIEKPIFKAYNAEQVRVLFSKHGSQLKGTASLLYMPAIRFNGSWRYDTAHGTGLFSCTNSTPLIPYTGYTIQEKGAQLTVQLRDNSLKGSFKLTAHHTTKQPSSIKGAFSGTPALITCKGTLQDNPYMCTVSLMPLQLLSLDYNKQQENKKLLSLTGKDQKITGTVSLDVIKTIVSLVSGYELMGEGTVSVTLASQGSNLQGSLVLTEGTIRLPYLYNVMQGFKTKLVFNSHERLLTLRDNEIKLHRGAVRCIEATIRCDEQWQPSFVHAPLVLQNCFVSWHQNLFALVSGSCLCTYIPERTTLKGSIIIDRAHLKGNILSDELAHQALRPGAPSPRAAQCLLDMKVLTKSPLKVKTPFLDAEAAVHCTIKGTQEHPEVAGTIDITKGTLAFPYKPLYITHGRIYLTPQELDDPALELQAKNKIKKFEIGLYVSGTLKQPVIKFESSPSLAEDQIITLLITGSEAAALTAVVPAMVMHNMYGLLFGPAETSNRVQKYFKSLLDKFQYIRVVPSLGDQQGKTGLKAAVEVEVSDRLRGSIEKNFSTTEDSKIEVEYDLSDELSLRGVKDEKGDLGAEIEMRLKF